MLSRQVKIAELPLDSFRMLQALEWEDQFSSPSPPATEHPLPLGKSSKADKDSKNKATENGSESGGLGLWSCSGVVVMQPMHVWCSMAEQGLLAL